MTLEKLSALVGVITSLIFSYLPGVKTWFDAQPGNIKRLLQVGVALVTTAALFGLGCAGVVQGFVCTWDGALEAIWLVVAFLIANQTAYSLTK